MRQIPLFAVTILLLSLCIGFTTASAEAGDPELVEFARYPAPSPDGTVLAFSWAGDLWTVPISGGRASRLTGSVGYDWSPIWSPDGSSIAFMSDANGSEDLYVIDASGGTPDRITFASNGDYLSGWTTDGKG